MQKYLIVLLVYSIINAVFLNIVSAYLLSFMQKSYYRLSAVFNLKFIKNNKQNINLCLIFMLCNFILMFTINSVYFLNFEEKVNTLTSFAVYAFSIMVFLLVFYGKWGNKNLRKTPRVWRIFSVELVLNFCASFLLMYFAYVNTFVFSISFVALTLLIMPITLTLSLILTYPIDYLIKKYYILKAKAKLKQNKNLIIIAITGSYGKTSVKNIIYNLLRFKFNTCVAPENFNTDVGVTRTINEHLTPAHEVLVLEMGADRNHDIKKICKIAKPNISVLTGIGNCHLKTFKTKRNIINTKYEIVEYATDFAVFNLNCKICKPLFLKTDLKKCAVSLNQNENVYAKNITYGCTGSSFEICGLFNENLKVNTKLLGEHNILNILQGVAVAKELGLTENEIMLGVNNLTPVKNRLELQYLKDGSAVLNDAYNANLNGAMGALNVLKCFSDYKICVTPGLVELGQEQYVQNYMFGKKMAEVCNLVVIVKNENRAAILEGLNFANFKNVKFAESYFSAMEIVKEITQKKVVLIENDLPSNYY